MIKLTPRLLTAVPFVRRGHRVCDVGTDHAYLPIYLVESGILGPRAGGEAPFAVASDINQGPVDRATLHVAAAGLSNAIRTLRTDGLQGLEAYRPEDVIIFGMGGELIASILDAAPWVRDPSVRLILQPMTHAEKLRKYLFERGYVPVGQVLSREEARIYQTICVQFSPDTPLPWEALSPAALHTGYGYPVEMQADHAELIRRTIRAHTVSRDARASVGLDVSEETALLDDLRALLERLPG